MSAWTDAQFVILSLGSLILAIAAYRGESLGLKRAMIMAFAWGAVFLLLAAGFGAIAPEPRPWRP